MRRSGFTLMAFVLGTIGVFYVWMRIDLLQAGYDIERLEQQTSELERQQESLQLRLSQLTAPQKIAKEAAQLGFHTPQPGQIVMVTPENAVPVKGGRSDKSMQLAQRLEPRSPR